MRMYDKCKIIPGLIVFVGLVSFPSFYNLGQVASKPVVSLDTPVINQMAKKQCVRPANEMKDSHMKLLNEWRYSAVREGDRVYGVIDGVEYEKSLQKTCMKCHSNKKDFCDKCHTYVNTKPYCWNCHIEPEVTK